MSVDESIRERDARATALNDDLHELHSTLASAVTEFEALLDETLDGLPEWVEADRDAIRELFQVDVDGQRVTMGPRAAALVASRVEIFVRSCTTPRSEPYDEPGAAKWSQQAEDLESLIVVVVDGAQEAGEVASAQLSATLDELVTALAEQEREEPDPDPAPDPDDKLDALRKKLRAGKVGAALATRESEADTLEIQRRKTEQLQDAWLPLTELAQAGGDLSLDAAGRLRAIMASAVAIATHTHPELAATVGEDAELPPLPDPPPPPVETAEPEPRTRADGSDALEEPRFRYDTDAPRLAQDTPATKPHTATATMEVSLSVEEFREPAFRITTAWRRVDLLELMLAIGAPMVYFAMITTVTIGYHVGFWADNPFVEWPAALPMFFAFAFWAIGFPAFMGWRVEWEGHVPRVLKMSDKREQSFVDVDEIAVEIANHRFDLAACGANLRRFEVDGERGWSLILKDADEEVLFASEASSGRWEDSNSDLVLREPHGAWRLSEEALLQIADRC